MKSDNLIAPMSGALNALMGLFAVRQPRARCKGCLFFFPDTGRYPRGNCHRHPHIGGWPDVDMDDWCGEFKEAPHGPD